MELPICDTAHSVTEQEWLPGNMASVRTGTAGGAQDWHPGSAGLPATASTGGSLSQTGVLHTSFHRKGYQTHTYQIYTQ